MVYFSLSFVLQKALCIVCDCVHRKRLVNGEVCEYSDDDDDDDDEGG